MRKNKFVKTKIIFTLGPSSNTSAKIKSLVKAGGDAIRLNFSHGTYQDHLSNLENIRKVEKSLGKPITIIQDLQGPRIRVGEISLPFIDLKRDQILKVTTEKYKGDVKKISVTYKYFVRDIKVGNRVLFDDGKIESRVIAIRGQEAHLRIIKGGRLYAHKGINISGVNISTQSFTDKDKRDIQFAFKNDVDYIALSFVRSAQDIKSLRGYIKKNGPKNRTIKIIAKIERAEAIKYIDEIINEADSVMVARGDLGVELSAEDVPVLQKMIVRKCNKIGKPVIIATQMLESMINNARPTRAEASDIANAVFDGADALMLSGETAVGKYPVEAVKVMNKVIKDAEKHLISYRDYNPVEFSATHDYDFLCQSASVLANELKSSAIVAITNSGTTAIRLAKYRPNVPILAITDNEVVLRHLNLVWGVQGIFIRNMKINSDVLLSKIENLIKKMGFVNKSEKILIVAGLPLFKKYSTNMIKVVTL